MTRTSLNKLSVAVLAVGIVGVAVALIVLRSPRGPLIGTPRHDFGLVNIEAEQAIAEHSFELTNRSTAPVTIASIRPSCGCTTATADRTLVPPGESVVITTALTLTFTGLRSTQVALVLDQDGVESIKTLFLHAVGRRIHRLQASRYELPVRPESEQRVTLFLEMQDSSGPPPRVEAIPPPGVVDVSYGDWSMRRPYDRKTRRPAIWTSQVTVRTGGPLWLLSGGGTLEIRVAPDQSIRIELKLSTETPETAPATIDDAA